MTRIVSMPVSDLAVTKNKTVTGHIEEESVTERIVTQIRDKIICGDLAPGTPLTEADLTKAFDVSRNTLREALRQICREGLAVHYRHRGVVVRTLTRTDVDRKSTRLNSNHLARSRMPSSA